MVAMNEWNTSSYIFTGGSMVTINQWNTSVYIFSAGSMVAMNEWNYQLVHSTGGSMVIVLKLIALAMCRQDAASTGKVCRPPWYCCHLWARPIV
jgi:hypothetical protein